MGAIPNKLPGFQDILDDEARAKFDAAWGSNIPPRHGWHLSDMFEAMERGDLTALYVIGENPAQSEAESEHAVHLLEGLDHLVVQDIFLTRTAQLASVVLPASAAWCESDGTVTNSERRVQRVRKALEPPEGARDDIEIILDVARRLGHDWHYDSSEAVWDELRSLSPMHAGMSYARLEELGGIQWPCYHEDRLEPTWLHGRLWAEDPAERGSPHRSPSWWTNRRSTSSTGSSRCASRPAAGWTPTTRACSRAALLRRCDSARPSTCRPRTPGGWTSRTGSR